MSRIDVRACGLSCAIVWASGIFLLGTVSACVDWGGMLVSVLGSLYIGYSSTIPGIIAGTLWAFVDGAIAGVIFAWLYNKLAKKG